METKQLIGIYKKKINVELEKFFDREIREANCISPDLSKLLENAKEYTMRGGKRLRAIHCILGYRVAGGADMKEIINTAISQELLQSYLLIHDDIMDESKVRRGGPTLHLLYEESHKQKYKRGDGKRFGESIATTLGDILESLAVGMIARSNFKNSCKIVALNEYTNMIKLVGYGQSLDVISGQKSPFDVTMEDVLRIYQYKTAVYTVVGPLRIGASLGGANKKTLDMLKEYGMNVGVAFQIVDDILGMGFGDPRKFQHDVGSDLMEGKKTILILKALENGTSEQKKTILSILGNKKLTNNELNTVKKIILQTGSLNYSQNYAIKLKDEATATIRKSDLSKDRKNMLIHTARELVERAY